MSNQYRNLWAKSLKLPEFYRNDANELYSHRGVSVYKVFDKHYDFVIGGACITQRAGAKDRKKVIDGILDGQEPVSDVVAAHLKTLGFSPLTYDEAEQRESEVLS